MLRFQSYIASILLMLFCHVMVPESAILALHEHEHTEEHDELTPDSELTIGKLHKHCKVKEYGQNRIESFPSVEVPTLLPFISTQITSFSFAWKFTYPNDIDLRGPPSILS